MALESASYISGLNPAWPAGSDSYHQGDDHIRLIKSVLRTTFPNITGPVTANQAQLNGAGATIPKGTRLAFLASAAPTGWVRVSNVYSCTIRIVPDGQNGGGGQGSHDPEVDYYLGSHYHTVAGYTTDSVAGFAPTRVGPWSPRMLNFIVCEKS